MPQFLNSSFKSSMQLVRYYSNFQNFYVRPHVCFLSLVKLEQWLAEVIFFPLSTPMAVFQHSRHF